MQSFPIAGKYRGQCLLPLFVLATAYTLPLNGRTNPQVLPLLIPRIDFEVLLNDAILPPAIMQQPTIMKKIISNCMFLSCVVSFIFACNTREQLPTDIVIDKEAIKREIQAKEDSFAALYNKGELRDIGYYAQDAITFYQNRPPLVGKEKILEFLKNDIISNTDRISFKTNEVFVSNDANLVVEIGWFAVVDSANNPLNTGNYMSLFEKRNGRYVAVRDMSVSDMPATLP